MHTGSLLSRLRALHQCEESIEASDRADLEEEPSNSETGIIEFKNSPEWEAAYLDVKSVLANREHLPTAAEREVKRMSRGR